MSRVRLMAAAKRIFHSVALVLGVMTIGFARCGEGTKRPSTGEDHPARANYSVAEVERAFSTAGLRLLRAKKGFFKVPNKGAPRVCGELHSADFRVEVTVCRHTDDDVLLLRRLPERRGAQFRQFNDADDLLDFLTSHPSPNGSKYNLVPLLVVDRGNITISYIGQDPGSVRKIRHAIELLR